MKKLLILCLAVTAGAYSVHALGVVGGGDGTGISESTADTLYLKKGNDTATGLSSHTFQTIQVNTGILGSGVLKVQGASTFGVPGSSITATGQFQLLAGSTVTSNGTLTISTAASAGVTETPALFIDAAGKVGIGTMPGSALAVFPNGSTNKIFIGANTTDATYNSISLNGDGSSARLGMTGGGGADANLYLDSPSGGSHRLRVGGTIFAQFGPTDFTINNTNQPGNYYLKTDTVGQDFFIEGATGNTSIGQAGGAPLPATKLDVNGSAQFGAGATKSTFTAAGLLDLFTTNKAGIDALDPVTIGEYVRVSDLTGNVKTCVSTGPAVAQFGRITDESAGCGSAE